MVKIFIAHSKDDSWLINQIANWLSSINIDTYLARLEDPTPLPLPVKILRAIKDSAAMFVFLTPNVADNKITRDIVNWEISQAYTLDKPVYVFREKGVEVPLMINYITVYHTYDPFNEDSLNEMNDRLEQITYAIKESEDKVKAAVTLAAFILGSFFFFGSLEK